jgi:hypothetical protein
VPRHRFASTAAIGAFVTLIPLFVTACSSSSSDDTAVQTAVQTAVETNVETVVDSTTASTTDTSVAAAADTTIAPTVAESTVAVTADDSVNIAGLPLDSAETVIVQMLGAPDAKSPTVEEGATGEFVSNWTWPSAGVTAKMAAASPTGPTVVRTLTVAAPSTLRTVAGIGIGSTDAEVRSAYGDSVSKESTPELLIVGSVYGGLLVSVADGKVTELFVGAAAE